MFSHNAYKNGSVINRAIPSLVKIWTRFGSKYLSVCAEQYVYDNYKKIFSYKFQSVPAWKQYIDYLNTGLWFPKLTLVHCTCKTSELYEYIASTGQWRVVLTQFLGELVPEELQTSRMVEKVVKKDKTELFFVRGDLQTENLIISGMSSRNIQHKIRKDLRLFYERYYSLFMRVRAEVIAQKCYEGTDELETITYETFRKRIQR